MNDHLFRELEESISSTSQAYLHFHMLQQYSDILIKKIISIAIISASVTRKVYLWISHGLNTGSPTRPDRQNWSLASDIFIAF